MSWVKLFTILFPQQCYLCTTSLQYQKLKLCTDCISKIIPAPNLCQACHYPLTNNHQFCDNCLNTRSPSLSAMISPYQYDKTVKELIQKMKFNRSSVATHQLAQLIKQPFIELLHSLDNQYTVIPVPSDRLRYSWRGFNPILHIMQLLQKEVVFKLNYQLIHKRSFTIPQNELSKTERLKNLNKAFTVNTRVPSNILLVDDVYTTGTTLEMISQRLKERGAKKIIGFTISIV